MINDLPKKINGYVKLLIVTSVLLSFTSVTSAEVNTSEANYLTNSQVESSGVAYAGPSRMSLTLSVDTNSIEFGDEVVLDWESKKATKCTASGGTNDWEGELGNKGSMAISNMEKTTRFSLVCKGNGFAVNRSVLVRVAQPEHVDDNVLSIDFSNLTEDEKRAEISKVLIERLQSLLEIYQKILASK